MNWHFSIFLAWISGGIMWSLDLAWYYGIPITTIMMLGLMYLQDKEQGK